MKMAEIREELYDLSVSYELPRLRELADATFRRTPVKRARAKAKKLTEEVKRHIRDVYAEHPDWSNRRIGQQCGVDGGRVSETLAGFRT